MCVLAQHIAGHDCRQRYTHTGDTRACHGGRDAEHIPDGFGLNEHITTIDQVVRAQLTGNGVEADAHQAGNCDTCGAGACDGSNDRAEGVVIFCLDGNITGGMDGNIGTGVSLGLDLCDDDVQSTAHGCDTAAGNTGCIRIYSFAGVGQDGNIAADLIVGSTGLGSVAEVCFGLVLEVGHNSYGRYGCGAGTGSGCRDVVQFAVGVGMDLQVAACGNGAAQSCYALVDEHQRADVACHTGGAGCAKGDTQQNDHVGVAAVQAGNHRYGAVCVDLAVAADGCFHFLTEYQGDQGRANTDGAGRAQRTCQIQ